MSIKDENVLAGKKTPEVIPVETKTTVSNAQTGKNTPMRTKQRRTSTTLQQPQQLTILDAMLRSQ